eukprot:6582222-Prymnesium_polylepis.2
MTNPVPRMPSPINPPRPKGAGMVAARRRSHAQRVLQHLRGRIQDGQPHWRLACRAAGQLASPRQRPGGGRAHRPVSIRLLHLLR